MHLPASWSLEGTGHKSDSGACKHLEIQSSI